MRQEIEKLLQKLFEKPQPSKKGQASSAYTEVLERRPQFLERYQTWKYSGRCEKILGDLSKAYYYKKAGVDSRIKVHLFNKPMARGFAVNFLGEHFQREDFPMLMEFFREILLGKGYRIGKNEVKYFDKENFVEVVESYQLKPNTFQQIREGRQLRQLYGNVHLEHVLADQDSMYLKLLVTTYQDANWEKAIPFEDFEDLLFREQLGY